MEKDVPPQTYLRGQRRALDAQWLAYLNAHGRMGNGNALLSDAHFARGLRQFNAGEYYKAHESFETSWRNQCYPERLFCQALTKMATALTHAERNNPIGALRLVTAALLLLSLFTPRYGRCDVRRFVESVESWVPTETTGALVIKE